MSNNAVVIDLETTSTTPARGRILSIGAARVNLETGEVGSTYYTTIQADAIYNPPTEDNPETMGWWHSQPRDALYEAFSEREHIYHALNGFCDWFKQDDPDNTLVFGNGPSFDISFLDKKFLDMEMEAPWKFFNIRDARTLEQIAEVFGVKRHHFKFTGVKHNALDDALYEAQYISAMYQKIMEGAKQ